MLTKVQKWGNSIALRIPKAFADEMQIAAETAVEISIEDGRLVISPVGQATYALEELVALITSDNLHDEIDWGAPVGKETW